MKSLLTFLVIALGIAKSHALVINEVMSNPSGTDNGREWIELYNETADPVDLASFSVSTSETGTSVALAPLQGGTSIPSHGYAIIATIVSGQTKFLEDYPSYGGILFRVASTFSLTNGNASLYLRSSGNVVTSISSYTAADEGKTLSFINGAYVAGTPTPGAENQASAGGSQTTSSVPSATTTDNQTTLPQLGPPSPDIVIYMPADKVAVAGAENEFSVTSANRAGKEIPNVTYEWAFGDGGRGLGSTTVYRYAYTGRYIAVVQANSPTASGKGFMTVRVVAPDIEIASIGQGKYGSYIDIRNPNAYDLDLSQWQLRVDGGRYPFPKNTLLPANNTTRFSGIAMGFASSTLSASSSIKILFPTGDEVLTYHPVQEVRAPTTSPSIATIAVPRKLAVHTLPKVLGASTTTLPLVATATVPQTSSSRRIVKDTRIVSWWKLLFGGK